MEQKPDYTRDTGESTRTLAEGAHSLQRSHHGAQIQDNSLQNMVPMEEDEPGPNLSPT